MKQTNYSIVEDEGFEPSSQIKTVKEFYIFSI